MDPHSKYKKQLEYYEHIEKQREKFINLSENLDTSKNEIAQLAEILFNKSVNNLRDFSMELMANETMESVDIFCMLIELMLYGLTILTNNNGSIFDLNDSTNEIVDVTKLYFKSAGFEIIIKQDFVEDDASNLYRDRNDYYCEIVPKPPPYFCYNDWYVLNYRMINNKRYSFDRTTSLNNFKAFFISNENKIYTITFKYLTKIIF